MSLPQHLPAEQLAAATLALQDARPHYVASLWRAASFAETEGQPMPLRRAHALNAVLRQCELPQTRGELLVGSGLGRLAESADGPALAAASEALRPFAGRHFGTHSDHAAPDYASLLRDGLGGLMVRTRAAAAALPREPFTASERHTFLAAVMVALQGAQAFVVRWADAVSAADHGPFADLAARQEAMLRRLAVEPPQTFHEALQLTLLLHHMMQLDDRYAMALGRADQFLWPFLRADLAAGRLDEGEAQALTDAFVAKLVHRGDIQNVCVGGLTPSGEDAVNPLSLMLVRSVGKIRRPGPNLTARIASCSPDAFVRACAECVRTGIGFPAVYNDDVQVPALADQGYALEDARDYCFVGCIEAHIQGKQAPWADSRFNLLRCADLALRGGIDGLTGERAGPDTGEPADWDAFYAAFVRQMEHGLDAHCGWICDMEREADARAFDLASPLLSALTADCIERGLDINDGGARYEANHGVAGMGIGSVADTLAGVRRFVYRQSRWTLPELRGMLDADFVGFEAERAVMLREAPKYGNDDEEVDGLAVQVAADFGASLLRRRLPRGGRFWGLMAANVQNVAAGLEVGATPDGRRSREPLSDAASPSFGRDRNGPTAVARSVAKLDYKLAPGGNVVNMKFHPSALAGDEGVAALAALIRTCFGLGGVQLQFNTAGVEMLRAAMEKPQDYADLVVRVSGFSAYFTRLDRAVQEDVLARTEHVF